MPEQDLLQNRTIRLERGSFRSIWRRCGILLRAVITALMVIVVGGAAVVGSSAIAARDAYRARRTSLVERDPVALDSWGMTQVGLSQMLTFVEASFIHDHWLRIGRCEQPGDGYGGIDWYANGHTGRGHFQGGLGISVGTWQAHDDGLPTSALAATPEQQMVVATRIYQHYGPGAWGCK